jgi:hypothetical protein
MSAWDIYQNRMGARGASRRETILRREVRMVENKIRDSLSYQKVIIDDVCQNVVIVDSDNLNEKNIFSLPGEDIRHGSLVCWKNNYWLVTERDANTTVYTRAKMIQCNHLLKWVSDDGEIFEQWCIVEDGTKYLTGELEDRNFVVTRGDSRIAMTIARNERTVKFNRENRFLIDDPVSEHKLAYLLTKPLKLGAVFNGDGVYKFVLQEVTATGDDNHELGIADYYKHFPKEESGVNTDNDSVNTDGTGKKVWI